MKSFFKYLLACLSGTLLGLLFFFLILAGIIGGIIASSSKPTFEVKPNSVLMLRLSEPISENSQFDPFSSILPGSGEGNVLGLHDILSTIKTAQSDKNIQGIVLYTDFIQAGYSTLTEIRNALEKFKESGKFVLSYGDVYSQKSYFLSSVANKVFINPEGMFELSGISAQVIFYKKLLEKIGLQPMVFKAGKYKSFVESVMRENMSAENKEQVNAYIRGVWSEYGKKVSSNRNNLPYTINQIADSLRVWNAETSVTYGLTDSLMYYDEFLDILREKLAIKKDDKIPYVSFVSYMQHTIEDSKLQENHSKNTLAVIVAQGSIVTGKGDQESIGSETISKEIRLARRDSTIKAIVFRINSGGGSALASEAIWREVSLAAKQKPVIVSMGDMAASGGYYIASPAHVIVASPTTLTGSIGVFGMLVNTQELFTKIGISVDTVKTNSFSDFGSPVREITNFETQILSKGIDKTYTTFKTRVAEGRKLTMAQVEEIAQGRIWNGNDAKKIGLVDTLGGLELAINIAIERAGIAKDYTVKYYPEYKTTLEQILDKISDNQTLAKQIELMVGADFKSYYSFAKAVPTQKGIYMQVPYFMKIE